MTTMATALVQWVKRTQSGWMTAPVGSAGVKGWSWVAPVGMARLLEMSGNWTAIERTLDKSCGAGVLPSPGADARIRATKTKAGRTHKLDRSGRTAIW